MTDDIEQRLRDALRPVAAPADLTAKILRALPRTRPGPATVTVLAVPPRAPRTRPWMPAALAASFVAAVTLGMVSADRRHEELARREAAEGMAARQALLQALRVTSDKLDLAYQAVNAPPVPEPEENRS